MRSKYPTLILKPTSANMMENASSDHDLLKSTIMAKFIIVCEFYYNFTVFLWVG